MEGVNLDNGTSSRHDDPRVDSVLTRIRHQQARSHLVKDSATHSVIVPVFTMSYHGIVGNEKGGGRKPISPSDAFLYKPPGQDPSSCSQTCHNLLAHTLLLTINMSNNMGDSIIPFISLNNLSTKLSTRKIHYNLFQSNISHT